VRFVLTAESVPMFRFAALQSDTGAALLQRSGRMTNDFSSVLLVTADECYDRSRAVLRIAACLRQPLPALAAVAWALPERLRDWLYDGLAERRLQVFGSAPACLLSQPKWRDRFLD